MMLHPGCIFHVIKIEISAEIRCNWMQLYVMVHYMHHYMKKCITCKSHEVYIYYMFYYMSLYFITKTEVPSLVDYMYITSITHILQQLHVLHTLYICIILFKSVFKMTFFFSLVAANLFNVHADVRSRPSTWFVACFLPS